MAFNGRPDSVRVWGSQDLAPANIELEPLGREKTEALGEPFVAFCILIGCYDFNCLPTSGFFRIKPPKVTRFTGELKATEVFCKRSIASVRPGPGGRCAHGGARSPGPRLGDPKAGHRAAGGFGTPRFVCLCLLRKARVDWRATESPPQKWTWGTGDFDWRSPVVVPFSLSGGRLNWNWGRGPHPPSLKRRMAHGLSREPGGRVVRLKQHGWRLTASEPHDLCLFVVKQDTGGWKKAKSSAVLGVFVFEQKDTEAVDQQASNAVSIKGNRFWDC